MSSGPHAHLKVVYFQLDPAAIRFARANCYRQQHFLLPMQNLRVLYQANGEREAQAITVYDWIKDALYL